MAASFAHTSLGTLTYDDGLNWYTGSAVANGERSDFHLSLDACDNEKALFDIAERRVSRLEPLLQAAKQYAAASLLQEINTQWLISSEASLSLAELVARFKVRSLTVYPDGTQDIILGPEKLFSGHCVIVSSDESGDFTEASVAA
jgi:hypothetical protein